MNQLEAFLSIVLPTGLCSLYLSTLQGEFLNWQSYLADPFLALHRGKVVLMPGTFFLPKVVSDFHLNQDIVLLYLLPGLGSIKGNFSPLFGYGSGYADLPLRHGFFQEHRFLFLQFWNDFKRTSSPTSVSATWAFRHMPPAFRSHILKVSSGFLTFLHY